MVNTAVGNAPPRIVAEIDGGTTIEGTKFSLSSTIKLRDMGEGKISMDYTPPIVEVTMADPIDINSNSEIKVPFNSTIDIDNTVFDFTEGESTINVLKNGVYDITYQLNSEYEQSRGGRGNSGSTSNSNVRSYIKVNDQNVSRRSAAYSYITNNEAENTTNTGGCVLELTAGDYVELCCKRTGNRAVTRLIEEETLLSIKLLKEL